MAYQRSNEASVQNAICEYLFRRRHFFWRSNTTGVYDSAKKTFRTLSKYAKKGAPDINVIVGGQYYGLEVKDKGDQSEDQKLFEIGCKIAGGKYYVVRSIDDVQKLGL